MTIYIVETIFVVRKTGKGNLNKKIILQCYEKTEAKKMIENHFKNDTIKPVLFLFKRLGYTDFKLNKNEKEKIILIS